ncbi:MAG: phage holin, LLH family [Candidatus Omnitrophica bacterium]|nr:phage holin, LLH family [Candidatus Omnitrophota bacterium]
MIFDWLKQFFLKALRVVNAVLKSVFTIGFKILMAKLQDIATETITKLASTNLSNEEKRNQAFNEIKDYAIAKMISVNDREINLIIETIYNALKNQGVIK